MRHRIAYYYEDVLGIFGVCIDVGYGWGKEKMDGEASVSLIQVICDHALHRTYTLRNFDILKGHQYCRSWNANRFGEGVSKARQVATKC